MHTPVLALAGPMQSWGYRSRFDIRDTNAEPTRSGVIGLLCAALGWPRQADLQPFDALTMGVRVDQEGSWRSDYHTVMDVLQADGKSTGTVVSHRHYLSDARFLVGLQGEDSSLEHLKACDAALDKPRFPLCLGRRSFTLSLPPRLPGGSLFENTDLETAMSQVPWIRLRPDEQAPDGPVRLVRDSQPDDRAISQDMGDWPINFDKRNFGLRSVTTSLLTLKSETEWRWPCISPK